MRTYFISRHPGAIGWARQQALAVDRFVPHLEPACIQPGDTVIGSLPVNLAAQVCAAGARYLHLSLQLPAALRGHELSADDLNRLGARLEQFHIVQAPGDTVAGTLHRCEALPTTREHPEQRQSSHDD